MGGDEERADPVADDLPLLREFIVRLGGSMAAAGDSVDSIHAVLEAVASAYGLDEFEFFVLPTGLFVESGTGASARVLLSTDSQRLQLRFDQIAALYELVHRAKAAEVSPTEGLSELARIERMRPRFGPVVRVLGHATLTAGLALLLQPTVGGFLIALGLGVLVGLLKLPRFATLDLVFPILATFVVATVVFAISHHTDLGDNPVRVLIPPLATFLPGALMTIATVELAAGQMVAGSSRLVAGLVRLGLLAFGIVAASELVGVDSAVLADNPVNRLGWWAPWLGVFIVALGDYLHFSAPARSMLSITAVLVVAYGGQTVGAALFGGELSGFFGALAMTPLVLWIDEQSWGPPTMVTFLPAFWLLVPGAIGLIGITEIIGVDHALGLEDLAATFTTIMSIALGVLIGAALYRTTSAGMRKVASSEAWHLPGTPRR